MDKYLNWGMLKSEIDGWNPRSIREGNVYWISVGQNIGSEIHGKGEIYSRPALCYRKLSKTTAMFVPLTSRVKEGSYYFQIKLQGKVSIICLNQARIMDSRRVQDYLGKVSDSVMADIKHRFVQIYG